MLLRFVQFVQRIITPTTGYAEINECSSDCKTAAPTGSLLIRPMLKRE